MNTKHLMKKLPSCLLGAILAAGIASTTMVNAVDGDPPGLFELEGNTVGEETAGDDWEVLYNSGGNNGGSPFAFTGIVADIATVDMGDRVFTQGGAKDISDVDEWKYTTGSTPDKNEITNAYAAAYNNPTDVCVDNLIDNNVVVCDGDDEDVIKHAQGDLIVYFGLDRYANDGDALAGFWFFQGEVGQTTPDNHGNGDFTGNHVAMRENPDFDDTDPDSPEFLPGDMFVNIAYPQGANAQPMIKVYQWDPLDADGDKNVDPDEIQNFDPNKPPKQVQGPLDLVISEARGRCGDNDIPLDGVIESKLACAITNPADLPGEPEWDYVNKDNFDGIPFESIFEGGINVTALLGSTPCFASFLAETRSSSSVTAQLKDFVFGAFPVCGIDVTKKCNAALIDGGTNVKVKFFGDLTNIGGSSYTAYLKDDEAGSIIDRVCVDLGIEGCENGTPDTTADDDKNVDGFTQNDDGSAYFPLTAGVMVRYEGHYTTIGLPANKMLDDTIMAQAFNEVGDIGLVDPIVEDSEKATCEYGYIAGLLVTKKCDALFVGGTQTTVHVSGTVENTGDVPLTMSLSDPFTTVSFDPPLADNILPAKTTAAFKGEKDVLYSDLILSVSADTNDDPSIVSKTVTLQHKDQVTATGKVIASDNTTIETKVEKSNEAVCGDTFTSSISVLKECDGIEVVPVDGKVVVKAKVKATVTNLGEEILNITSLLDNPALDGGFSGVPASLAVGAHFTASGFYYPSAVDGDGTDPGSASFTDTATANATGVSSSATLNASDDVKCDLCPD